MRRFSVLVIAVGLLVSTWAPTATATTADGHFADGAGVDLDPAIVGGGGTTNPGYIAAILQRDVTDGFQAQFCGGALIAPDVVLTAAHCVDTLPPARLDVAVGVTVLDQITPADRIDVTAVAIHPEWDSNRPVDLALMRLAEPVAATPVGVEHDPDEPSFGRPLDLRGWGATNTAGDIYANELERARMLALSSVSTPSSVTEELCFLSRPDDYGCFGAGTVAACFGDSGSPLMSTDWPGATPEVQLVVSFGPPGGCRTPDMVDAGTRVSVHRSWIESVALGWGSPLPYDDPGPDPDPQPAPDPVRCVNAVTPFRDVARSSFAFASVGCLYGLDITTGTSTLFYSPTGLVTREQMAAFIARTVEATGQECPSTATPFTDVPATSFAASSVRCLYGLGITTGTSATAYSPAGLVTRDQMAAFIARTVDALGGTCPDDPTPFTDVPATSFAAGSVRCLHGLGITTGTSPTTYSPDGLVTREQMAAFIARTVDAVADQTDA